VHGGSSAWLDASDEVAACVKQWPPLLRGCTGAADLEKTRVITETRESTNITDREIGCCGQKSGERISQCTTASPARTGFPSLKAATTDKGVLLRITARSFFSSRVTNIAAAETQTRSDGDLRAVFDDVSVGKYFAVVANHYAGAA